MPAPGAPAPVVPEFDVPAPEVPAPVVVGEPAEGPFGFGADAAGIVELGVPDVVDGAELVGAPVPLSVRPAPLVDGSVCGVVGVHATSAATASEAAATRRRGCERYIEQLLQPVREQRGIVADAGGRAKRGPRHADLARGPPGPVALRTYLT